ncbi:hypothetical protein GCM10012279_24880 [Micromonospora yangpuensis]|nr:hypothetical protein GCM10012279_24880 [Micromonospora yangpuensis]
MRRLTVTAAGSGGLASRNRLSRSTRAYFPSRTGSSGIEFFCGVMPLPPWAAQPYGDLITVEDGVQRSDAVEEVTCTAETVRDTMSG